MYLSLDVPQLSHCPEEKRTPTSTLAAYSTRIRLHRPHHLLSQWRFPLSSRVLVHELVSAYRDWPVPGAEPAAAYRQSRTGSIARFGRAIQASAI